MLKKRFLPLCAPALWVALWLPLGGAHAALTIEITEGVPGALPIAVVPFGAEGQGAPPDDIGAIVAAARHRSGRVAPLAEQDLLARPHEGREVNFRDWRVLGVEGLAVGKVRATGAGQYTVQFQLFNVFQATQLAGYTIPTTNADLRRTAHQISDIIYEKLTGEPGAFNTRIAYVTAAGKAPTQTYSLQVADADGHNPRTILNSKQPLLSPAWSPDGTRLAYVSFENKRAQIYIQEIATGKRELIASYPGLNGAPAWSPDGTRIALTLSKDGNPEIYVLSLAAKTLQRLTSNPAIDTEPVWSPDGSTLVFTSDRGGRPQLYRMSASGSGEASRITFAGDYNARGVFSPDGKQLAMVHGTGGQYRIALLELQTGALRVLSDRTLDESPSFAPNGAMIIYATNENNRGTLAAVSVDGRVHNRLVLQEGDVREAVWSPFGRRIMLHPDPKP
ncbi:MAG: Tol-Pal system beta propeller repeat protein TolB [Gammaproteobacteria bacterium]|nr:Tol-Pal system beta propeller repeat protein TolB [Gammaproteobacteria bacterium]